MATKFAPYQKVVLFHQKRYSQNFHSQATSNNIPAMVIQCQNTDVLYFQPLQFIFHLTLSNRLSLFEQKQFNTNTTAQWLYFNHIITYTYFTSLYPKRKNTDLYNGVIVLGFQGQQISFNYQFEQSKYNKQAGPVIEICTFEAKPP